MTCNLKHIYNSPTRCRVRKQKYSVNKNRWTNDKLNILELIIYKIACDLPIVSRVNPTHVWVSEHKVLYMYMKRKLLELHRTPRVTY